MCGKRLQTFLEERSQHKGEGKGMLTMHLIHHILVRAPTLNSGWWQCHALGGVAKGWGNWIGIRHWVSDNKRYPSLSHGLSALLWLPGILFAHSLSPFEADKSRRAWGGPPGLAQSGSLVCGPVVWRRLCEPLCADAWSPKAQGSFVWSLP